MSSFTFAILGRGEEKGGGKGRGPLRVGVEDLFSFCLWLSTCEEQLVVLSPVVSGCWCVWP